VPTPRAIRITRLVSRPGLGPELAERCRRIAERERVNYPGAYHVIQGRMPLDGDRVELVSITEWYDLDLMARLMPAGDHAQPAFYEEYADCIEDWRVEALEVTWPVA
jgi:hypothetical protein